MKKKNIPKKSKKSRIFRKNQNIPKKDIKRGISGKNPDPKQTGGKRNPVLVEKAYRDPNTIKEGKRKQVFSENPNSLSLKSLKELAKGYSLPQKPSTNRYIPTT